MRCGHSNGLSSLSRALFRWPSSAADEQKIDGSYRASVCPGRHSLQLLSANWTLIFEYRIFDSHSPSNGRHYNKVSNAPSRSFRPAAGGDSNKNSSRKKNNICFLFFHFGGDIYGSGAQTKHHLRQEIKMGRRKRKKTFPYHNRGICGALSACESVYVDQRAELLF